MTLNRKEQYRKLRHKRVRARIKGTARVPRLAVFRSNRKIYAQLVDDENNKVLTAKSALKTEKNSSFIIGKTIAEMAKKQNITGCVFDRNGYKYHGRVKALAEGAREGGLKF